MERSRPALPEPARHASLPAKTGAIIVMPTSLNGGRLYAFVFGPGYGESVAVRVPPDEWLVIDSCRIAKQSAASHVLRRYGGKLTVLLLTHVHKDHYRGFVDLI